MFYTLYRSGESLPEPFTFNTESLENIRNFLVWELVDSVSGGDESLKGYSISTYNIDQIQWDTYDTDIDEIKKSIDEIYSNCSDEKISKFKEFRTSDYYSNPNDPSQICYTVDANYWYVLVISEKPFDAKICYEEFLDENKFMFGARPWLD
jgi:hypothetical protein